MIIDQLSVFSENKAGMLAEITKQLAEADIDIDVIEKGLRDNFHYDYCRKLGQLKKAEFVKVQNGEQQYINNCLKFGMRLGDIKPACLSNREGWVFK